MTPHRRRRRPTSTIDVWRAHPGYAGAFSVVVTLAIGLGASALISRPSRYSSAVYAALREIGIGNVGIVLLAGAALLLVSALGRAWHTAVLLGVGAVIYGTLAAWFWIAARADENAAYWGVWFAGCIAVWHVTQAAAYLAVPPPQRWSRPT